MATPEFEVLRGTSTIPSSGNTVTIVEGIDYTLPSGADNTNSFARITNTRHTGMGVTSGGGTQDFEDFSCFITAISDVSTSITFARQASPASNSRVDWEIICYIGAPGGVNEWIVRRTDTSTWGTNDLLVDSPNTAFTDVNDGLVITTGARSDTVVGNTDWWSFLGTASFNDAGGGFYNIRYERGTQDTTLQGEISYVALELVGSNWTVNRQVTTEEGSNWNPGSPNNSASVALTTPIASTSNTFIYAQVHTDNDPTGVDEAGDTVEVLDTTNFIVRSRSATGITTKVVWIVENPIMTVEHVSFYDATTSGSEERSFTQSITAVTSLSQTSLFGQASVDNSAGAPPIGSINYRLTDTSTITFTESDVGEERRIYVEVVQWPAQAAAGIYIPIPRRRRR
jgi:hypothetical protein